MIEKRLSTNYTLTCCLPLFLHCRPFLEGSSVIALPNNFREIIEDEFTKFESLSRNYQFDETKISYLKYAIASFIDESVMYSTWLGKYTWMGKSLQLKYFSEHLAGEGFFNRLHQLQNEAPNRNDIIEIYYLCLQLGFKGYYRYNNKNQLDELKDILYRQVKANNVSDDHFWLEDAYPQGNVKDSKKFRFFPIFISFFMCLILIYLAFSINMNIKIANFLKEISIEQIER